MAAAIAAIPLEIDRIRSTFEAGLAQFTGTSRLDAARYLPAGGRALAWDGRGRLVGWSLQAVDGPVTLIVRDGRDEHGEPVAVVDLADAQTATVWLGPGGVSCPNGLYLDRTGAGTLAGAVWLGAVD
jgi:hypothetical protein